MGGLGDAAGGGVGRSGSCPGRRIKPGDFPTFMVRGLIKEEGKEMCGRGDC